MSTFDAVADIIIDDAKKVYDRNLALLQTLYEIEDPYVYKLLRKIFGNLGTPSNKLNVLDTMLSLNDETEEDKKKRNLFYKFLISVISGDLGGFLKQFGAMVCEKFKKDSENTAIKCAAANVIINDIKYIFVCATKIDAYDKDLSLGSKILCYFASNRCNGDMCTQLFRDVEPIKFLHPNFQIYNPGGSGGGENNCTQHMFFDFLRFITYSKTDSQAERDENPFIKRMPKGFKVLFNQSNDLVEKDYKSISYVLINQIGSSVLNIQTSIRMNRSPDEMRDALIERYSDTDPNENERMRYLRDQFAEDASENFNRFYRYYKATISDAGKSLAPFYDYIEAFTDFDMKQYAAYKKYSEYTCKKSGVIIDEFTDDDFKMMKVSDPVFEARESSDKSGKTMSEVLTESLTGMIENSKRLQDVLEDRKQLLKESAKDMETKIDHQRDELSKFSYGDDQYDALYDKVNEMEDELGTVKDSIYDIEREMTKIKKEALQNDLKFRIIRCLVDKSISYDDLYMTLYCKFNSFAPDRYQMYQEFHDFFIKYSIVFSQGMWSKYPEKLTIYFDSSGGHSHATYVPQTNHEMTLQKNLINTYKSVHVDESSISQYFSDDIKIFSPRFDKNVMVKDKSANLAYYIFKKISGIKSDHLVLSLGKLDFRIKELKRCLTTNYSFDFPVIIQILFDKPDEDRMYITNEVATEYESLKPKLTKIKQYIDSLQTLFDMIDRYGSKDDTNILNADQTQLQGIKLGFKKVLSIGDDNRSVDNDIINNKLITYYDCIVDMLKTRLLQSISKLEKNVKSGIVNTSSPDTQFVNQYTYLLGQQMGGFLTDRTNRAKSMYMINRNAYIRLNRIK